MVVTESGMVMLANELHSMNAQYPTAVTESGMVTVFTFSTPHISHESSPSVSQERRDTIVVVLSGMCPSALMLTAAILLAQPSRCY